MSLTTIMETLWEGQGKTVTAQLWVGTGAPVAQVRVAADELVQGGPTHVAWYVQDFFSGPLWVAPAEVSRLLHEHLDGEQERQAMGALRRLLNGHDGHYPGGCVMVVRAVIPGMRVNREYNRSYTEVLVQLGPVQARVRTRVDPGDPVKVRLAVLWGYPRAERETSYDHVAGLVRAFEDLSDQWADQPELRGLYPAGWMQEEALPDILLGLDMALDGVATEVELLGHHCDSTLQDARESGERISRTLVALLDLQRSGLVDPADLPLTETPGPRTAGLLEALETAQRRAKAVLAQLRGLHQEVAEALAKMDESWRRG